MHRICNGCARPASGFFRRRRRERLRWSTLDGQSVLRIACGALEGGAGSTPVPPGHLEDLTEQSFGRQHPATWLAPHARRRPTAYRDSPFRRASPNGYLPGRDPRRSHSRPLQNPRHLARGRPGRGEEPDLEAMVLSTATSSGVPLARGAVPRARRGGPLLLHQLRRAARRKELGIQRSCRGRLLLAALLRRQVAARGRGREASRGRISMPTSRAAAARPTSSEPGPRRRATPSRVSTLY